MFPTLSPTQGLLGVLGQAPRENRKEFKGRELSKSLLLEGGLLCYFVFHMQCEHLLPAQRLAAYL